VDAFDGFASASVEMSFQLQQFIFAMGGRFHVDARAEKNMGIQDLLRTGRGQR
jgi:hypothetical protein